jgi:hypothetical protein
MKIKLTIEVELESHMIPDCLEEKTFFDEEIYIGDKSLSLFSNEIGDTIGYITNVDSLEYIDEPVKRVVPQVPSEDRMKLILF